MVSNRIQIKIERGWCATACCFWLFFFFFKPEAHGAQAHVKQTPYAGNTIPEY